VIERQSEELVDVVARDGHAEEVSLRGVAAETA
jgi:hypothetical protein